MFSGPCDSCRRWTTAGLAFLSLFTGCGPSHNAGNRIEIAVVGPLTGDAAARGQDMQRAVSMAADEANAAGGVNSRFVSLTVYDDGDQPERAEALARKIADTHAVAVLGQVASSAGYAAGKVYREREIPAITGAASEARVTKNNPWYFRMLRDADGQGQFMADYVRYRFSGAPIAVLRENGTAGDEFASAFRDRSLGQRVRVAIDTEFSPAQARDASFLSDLGLKLRKLPKNCIFVLGTQYAETASVLHALRDTVGPFTGVGYSSVATENLNAQLARFETDRHPAGYYASGFYVAAPELPDVAGFAQTVFASRFKTRYGTDPSPESVRWYEATELVFQALSAKGANRSNPIADRRAIREWLSSRDRPEAAAAGIAGPIYFDKDHNVQRSLAVGLFYAGQLISAPVQLIQVDNSDDVPGWDRLTASNMTIDTGGSKFVKTPVVYAGIDLNSLDNIDVRTGTFAADFFVWFRYKNEQDLDVHEVEFPTAVSGAQIGKEVWRRTQDGFTTVTYHVKGVFHADYEFSRFPFDEQTLRIPIQVRNSSSYSLILAYGQDRSKGAGNGASQTSVLSSRLWRLQNQLFYRDVVAYRSAFGTRQDGRQSAIEYNRVNAAIIIKRDVLGFAVKNFLPLLCILVAVLIGYALAPDVINPRISIGVTALLTTSVLYQKLASDLPSVTYIIAMDFVFFAFFASCVIFLALTVVTYELHKSKKHKPTNLLNQSGTIITVLGLLGTLTFVWVRYWSGAA